MKKRFLTVALSLVMGSGVAASLASCGEGEDKFKFGLICLHDETSTYDKNFIDAARRAVEEVGLDADQFIMKTGIPELSECKEAALDLVDQGCDLIFADSFGHEPFVREAAEENPDVEFCHATGVTAASSGLDNFHNAFASIYEGRYLAGVVAGMKLNEMIEEGEFTEEEAKIGYVGAYTYAEVISGYTSFYLGAKSVCPTVTMDVQFTGSWFDISAEKSTAESLIAGGCKLISQHADSMGAPSACEEAGVPNVSYNGSTFEACPETFLVSSYIDWTPYFKYILEKAMTGEEIADDWTGTLETGSVKITEFGTAIADGTEEKVVEVEKSLLDGTLNVFDTSKFTVNGETLTSYMVDIDGDGEKEIEAIKDGVFQESIFRTAPYFDIKIDGIKLLNEKV